MALALSNQAEHLRDIIVEVVAELRRAEKRYSQHPTIEHSMCVLEEEVSELRAEIFKQHTDRDRDLLRKEAVQVAAMAIRLLLDNKDHPYERKMLASWT